MDFVDEVRGRFVDLDGLQIDDCDRSLILKLLSRYGGHRLLFMPIDRGLSGCRKIVAKPESMFPVMIKMGPLSEILMELHGYDLLRLRVPPTNLLQLDAGPVELGSRGAISFRYVTGGLISNPVGRLDVFVGSGRPQASLVLCNELFDVVLKKCHWSDGHVKLSVVQLPSLSEPDGVVDGAIWEEITRRYRGYEVRAHDCRVPMGIVHGDLHPKNILVSRHDEPILIDFTMVSSNRCVYADYSKLEAQLQFQVKASISEAYWHVSERMYFHGQLILPRSNRELSSCVHAIRTTLWKTCLSKTVALSNEEIDWGYGGYLLYHLARFWSRTGHTEEARNHALTEIRSLTPFV
jgi:hypothetical protein